MPGNGHVGFGERDRETGQPKDWHGALSRPNVRPCRRIGFVAYSVRRSHAAGTTRCTTEPVR